MRSSTPVLAMLLALVMSFPAAVSDHVQDGSGASFNHVGGNEWWVEVMVEHGGRPDSVAARDEGDSTWHPLEFKSWGEWAASFHIEPGHRVMFRSVQDGTEALSCWFTHPEGVEQCDARSGDFDATFDTPGGNEWWVEVYVDADAPVVAVDARDDDGAWVPLEKKSWGAWAASFHVEDGSLVDFRAHAQDGDTDVSGKYQWPEGTPVEGDPGGGSGALTQGAFGPKASNPWWVETMVVADGAVSSVEARADGGAWRPLTLRDWGAWAASFHVPDGSIVEFRAHGADGGTIASDGFVWPQADPVSGDAQWPHDGAYVQMDYRKAIAGTTEIDLDVVFVFKEGVGWYRQCTGVENQDDPVFVFGHLAPPTGTIGTVGDEVSVWVLKGCDNNSVTVTITGEDEIHLHQDGEPVTADTIHASHQYECGCDYDEVDWGPHPPRLVYRFHNGGTETHTSRVVDTNAPV